MALAVDPQQNTAQLFREIRARDLQNVKALIIARKTLGVGINSTEDSTGDTPLIVAARSGTVPIAIALLEAGVNFRISNRKGQTAFMLAVRTGKDSLARRLAERGANINASDKEGKTSLMWAVSVKNPNPQIISLLINAGANIHAADKKGQTALHLAVQNPNIIVADLKILQQGFPNLFSVDEFGQTPLDVALNVDANPKIIKYLQKQLETARQQKKKRQPQTTFDFGVIPKKESTGRQKKIRINCDACETELSPEQAKMCGGCNKVAYCNKDCQRNGWFNGNHQSECTAYLVDNMDNLIIVE